MHEFTWMNGKKAEQIYAVKDVSFGVKPGATGRVLYEPQEDYTKRLRDSVLTF